MDYDGCKALPLCRQDCLNKHQIIIIIYNLIYIIIHYLIYVDRLVGGSAQRCKHYI